MGSWREDQYSFRRRRDNDKWEIFFIGEPLFGSWNTRAEAVAYLDAMFPDEKNYDDIYYPEER